MFQSIRKRFVHKLRHRINVVCRRASDRCSRRSTVRRVLFLFFFVLFLSFVVNLTFRIWVRVQSRDCRLSRLHSVARAGTFYFGISVVNNQRNLPFASWSPVLFPFAVVFIMTRRFTRQLSDYPVASLVALLVASLRAGSAAITRNHQYSSSTSTPTPLVVDACSLARLPVWSCSCLKTS
jgi:hypothetical protein